MGPKTNPVLAVAAAALVVFGGSAPAQAQAAAGSVPVTVENFPRAESDRYFAGIIRDGSLGRFTHRREPARLENQTVIRLNRDTLYSSAVFDLDAGPVTVVLPDAGKRFMSMQVFDEDQYTRKVAYKPGKYTFTRKGIGTRYIAIALRILADPADANDLKAAHALQDAVKAQQPGGPGTFVVPAWDPASQKKVRDALIVLADTLPDKNHMFGTRKEVDPVRFLLGVDSAWGGNPDKEAIYLNVFPEKNDGATLYRLKVPGDVPVDGFWSVSLYNGDGYFQKNDLGAYSVNNITGRKSPDGSLEIVFGGCDGKAPNCLPIMPGWNYLVRLYRPRPEILEGKWKFPAPEIR